MVRASIRYTAVVSPLSDVQFSRFTETEVAKLLTFGSRGLLEVMVPLTDDERRDIEAHLKEHFRLSLALQVKASHVLYGRGRIPRFQKSFMVKAARLVEDEFFWYFFGFMDLQTMAFREPVFLVPSHVVHAEAVHRRKDDVIYFNFVASMDPKSKDRWRPYACAPAEVAFRVVSFLKAYSGHPRAGLTMAAPGRLPDGTIWVGRPAA